MATRAIEVITFDCYGTLIDWDAGIRGAFGTEALRSGSTYDGDLVMELYHEEEPEVQTGPFRPYREVLAEVARRVTDRLSMPAGPEGASFLADGLPDWPPFPDTGAALERLAAAGYRLGILSNVDDDLLAGTRRHLPDVFDDDLIVTAQRVGSYKPAPGHFEEARHRIGDRGWLHAAQSLFHDIRPASSMAIPAAWINRYNDPRPAGGPEPAIEVATLAELADRLSRGEGAR